MAEPFLAEIRVMSFGFPPKGWALCNGQLLPINQNQALFSLLGTTYGGDGRVTFGLPNLQGRVPIHMGGGFTQGEAGGESTHQLAPSEMPRHTHTPQANSNSGNINTPGGNAWSRTIGPNQFSQAAPDVTMNAGTSGNAGQSQAHNNMSPCLALNFCIALQGIFPSPN